MDSDETQTSGEHPAAKEQAVDLERLADKVYKLMQEELRLEAARCGRNAAPRSR
jgi:hypothetical protein